MIDMNDKQTEPKSFTCNICGHKWRSAADTIGRVRCPKCASNVSIGVRESVKRVGVGELLMLSAFQQARMHGCKELTLEVRASNDAAQSLYRKYGFQNVGLRKKYYIDNAEDAIIMTTPPISSVEYAVMLDSLARNHAERWGHLPEPIA